MPESKYARWAAYNRKTYVRFPLDLKPDVLQEFKEKCADPNHYNQTMHRIILRPKEQGLRK